MTVSAFVMWARGFVCACQSLRRAYPPGLVSASESGHACSSSRPLSDGPLESKVVSWVHDAIQNSDGNAGIVEQFQHSRHCRVPAGAQPPAGPTSSETHAECPLVV